VAGTDHGARIQSYVRGLIDREAENGWTRLRRVPSTYTWKMIDYVSALPDARRGSLFDAFAANALHAFEPGRPPGLHAYQSGHVEYRAMVEALPRMPGFDYLDARMLRAILGDLRSANPSPQFQSFPPDVIARAEAIRPTSAGEIRKAVKQVFGERFGAKPEDRKGGNWRYAGEHAGRPFTAHIDYGGRGDQLRYHVAFDDERLGLHVRAVHFEGLIGMGHGQWDFVTADNLAESIALLADFVAELVTIPSRL
jgi:hypothetical protein